MYPRRYLGPGLSFTEDCSYAKRLACIVPRTQRQR